MNLFIETCLDDFFIAIYDENWKIKDYIHKKNLKKKSDFLPNAFEELIKSSQNQIKNIYVTKGPGSFMGIRAGLLFATTLAQLYKINLYVASTLDLVNINKESNYSINAGSGHIYTNENGKEIIIEGEQNYVLDYDELINDFKSFLSIFSKGNPETIKPNYIKEPTIG